MSDTWGALSLPAPFPAVGLKRWAASTVYAAQTMILVGAFAYQCTTAGTSGVAPPAWPTAIGGAVNDNGTVWTCFATHQLPDAADDVPFDPLLQVLLSYLRTAVPPMLSAAWGSPGVAPNRSLIGWTFPYDPEKYGVHEAKLPALFAFREGESTNQWLASDWQLDVGRIVLLYVFEPFGDIEVQKIRSTLASGLRKAFIEAIENERDPSWVVLNDPDPTAATEGSVFARFAGFYELAVGAGKPGIIRPRSNTDKPIEFHTYEIALTVRERQTRDITLFPVMLGLSNTYKVIAIDGDPSPFAIGGENDYAPAAWSAHAFVWKGSLVNPNVGPWSSATTHAAGDLVTPVAGSKGLAFRAGAAGTTGGSEPVWPIVAGQTVTDNGITWTATADPTGYTYRARNQGTTVAAQPIWPVPPNPQNLAVTVLESQTEGAVLWQCVAAPPR